MQRRLAHSFFVLTHRELNEFASSATYTHIHTHKQIETHTPLEPVLAAPILSAPGPTRFVLFSERPLALAVDDPSSGMSLTDEPRRPRRRRSQHQHQTRVPASPPPRARRTSLYAAFFPDADRISDQAPGYCVVCYHLATLALNKDARGIVKEHMLTTRAYGPPGAVDPILRVFWSAIAARRFNYAIERDGGTVSKCVRHRDAVWRVPANPNPHGADGAEPPPLRLSV